MKNTRMLQKRCHEGILKLKSPYVARLFDIFIITPTRQIQVYEEVFLLNLQVKYSQIC